MALEDRLLQNTPTPLPGNLNKAELFALARAKNKKEQEDLNAILSGNLNRTEMDLLRESEPEVGSFSEIRGTIRRLLSSGTPTGKILEIMSAISPMGQHKLMKLIGEMISAGASGSALMSPAEGQFGGSPHSEGPFWRQYNQGGIVSLRHLTRPLGI